VEQPSWGSRDRLALSISEAAQVCGVRRRTIRRRHQAGEFEHAFKDPEGAWRIPVSDLVAAGLRPNIVSDPDEPRIVFTAASQVDRLRTEVAVLRERVRALEIIAREREERVTDLRTILRMLPGAREPVEDSEVVAETPAPEIETATAPAIEAVPAPDQETVPAPEPEPVPAEFEPYDRWEDDTEPPVEIEEEFISDDVEEEPILILPDAPPRSPEQSERDLERSEEVLETARQRSGELLDDAMSMWWPSAVSPARSDSPLQAFAPLWDSPSAEGVDVAEAPGESSPAVPSSPQGAAGEPSDAAPGEPDAGVAQETTLDWPDPNFGRPPRHLRRRLGRFFKRNRRPR
jgi:hypothetical protein